MTAIVTLLYQGFLKVVVVCVGGMTGASPVTTIDVEAAKRCIVETGLACP